MGKDAHLPHYQCVIGEKFDKSLQKIEKCIFVKFVVSQNYLLDEKMVLKKVVPDGNLALKTTYRTRIWPSDILTGHDFFGNIF